MQRNWPISHEKEAEEPQGQAGPHSEAHFEAGAFGERLHLPFPTLRHTSPLQIEHTAFGKRESRHHNVKGALVPNRVPLQIDALKLRLLSDGLCKKKYIVQEETSQIALTFRWHEGVL